MYSSCSFAALPGAPPISEPARDEAGVDLEKRERVGRLEHVLVGLAADLVGEDEPLHLRDQGLGGAFATEPVADDARGSLGMGAAVGDVVGRHAWRGPSSARRESGAPCRA